jgi:hypothetical protein
MKRAFATIQLLTACLTMCVLALASGFAVRLFCWAAGF